MCEPKNGPENEPENDPEDLAETKTATGELLKGNNDNNLLFLLLVSSKIFLSSAKDLK